MFAFHTLGFIDCLNPRTNKKPIQHKNQTRFPTFCAGWSKFHLSSMHASSSQTVPVGVYTKNGKANRMSSRTLHTLQQNKGGILFAPVMGFRTSESENIGVVRLLCFFRKNAKLSEKLGCVRRVATHLHSGNLKWMHQEHSSKPRCASLYNQVQFSGCISILGSFATLNRQR